MIISSVEWFIAMRYLKARGKGVVSVIAGFSLLGIALGVAALIIVMAVMNGFRLELTSRILGVNGHITLYGIGKSIEDYDKVAQEIEAIEAVTSAFPMITGQAMAVANGHANGTLVKGISAESLLRKTIVASNIVAGNIDDFTGRNVIMIGQQMAQNLGLSVGDKLQLVSPQTISTVLGSIPRVKDYTIIGLFHVGMYEYDSNVIFMPLAAAQRYFRYGNTVSEIELFTQNPQEINPVIDTIFRTLDAPYRISDWQQQNSHFLNALIVERKVMFIILTLIILVAAFNIISSLIMLVKDKRMNIAILRSMGATSGSILRIFFTCGASIGLIGTTIGVVLGTAFAANIQAIQRWVESFLGQSLFDPLIYFLSELPAKIIISDIVSVIAMALSLSFLATLYPAWKAAKTQPVEVLRGE